MAFGMLFNLILEGLYVGFFIYHFSSGMDSGQYFQHISVK